jgi:predicted peroxiredoxin
MLEYVIINCYKLHQICFFLLFEGVQNGKNSSSYHTIDEGHSVTLFLAGDGVQLMRNGVIDHLSGLGTGDLRELYDSIVSNGAKIYLSGMSSKTRGLSEEELEGKPYEFAGPKQLVQLAVDHDRVFTY